MKTSPNDKCPCGSGKKYKRCCQDKDEAERSAQLLAEQETSGEHFEDGFEDGFEGELKEEDLEEYLDHLPPYALARLAEKATKGGQRGMQLPAWTLSRVAAMSTESIEGQLRSFGVAHTRERFLSLAQDKRSAWTVGETWLAEDPVTCRDGEDQVFLGLAACELWKRWTPERPSDEMLDDWVQQGYALRDEEHDFEAAVERWWKVWEVLSPRVTPEMTLTVDADEVFDGAEAFATWLFDLGEILSVASGVDRRWAEAGLRFVDWWLAQFTGEDESDREYVRMDRALYFVELGDTGAGEAELRSSLERRPEDPWGYIHFAEYLVNELAPTGRSPDRPAARAVLEKGLERVPKDAPHYEMLSEVLGGLDDEPRPAS